MKLLSCLILSALLLSSPAQSALKEGRSAKAESPKAKSAPPKTEKPSTKNATPKKVSPATEPSTLGPVYPRGPEYVVEEARPRPKPIPFALSKSRWRIRAGGFGGWWWGDLRDKEREYADGILVNLGGGDYERLKLFHTVIGPFASASYSVRPWLSTGVRAHMIFVTQTADLPEDVERVSGGVWRTGGLQSTLTFYFPRHKRVQPYLELAYGPAWGSWSPYAAANEMPPRQRQESFGANGELWGLGIGWEYAQTSRSGWLVDLRWNVGDFSVEEIPKSQYNGHFTIGIGAVLRP